jgi:hypothetical protein
MRAVWRRWGAWALRVRRSKYKEPSRSFPETSYLIKGENPMNDRQRRRYERGLRARDYAATVKDSFAARSKGATSVARIAQLIDNLSALDVSHATNRRVALAGTSSKQGARAQLRAMLSRLNRTARVIGADDPELKDRFRLADGNPNAQELLSTARSFLAEAAPHKARFVEYGLADDFLDTLEAQIAAFENSATQQNTGASARKANHAAIESALESLDAEVERLDAILRNTFTDDASRLAAWESARRIERTPRKTKATGTGQASADKPATNT